MHLFISACKEPPRFISLHTRNSLEAAALIICAMVDPLAHIFSTVGGSQPFYDLVDKFYEGVESDPVLRPLYPQDLTEPKKNLALFLIQRTGGPTTYSDMRGHPRMRARHMPFSIGKKERDAWMVHMSKALVEVPEFNSVKDTLHSFFDDFATFMINQSE